MKFNKIVALALALVMVFALCACGGGTDTKKDDSNSASKVDTSTVSVGAVVIARDDVPTDQIYAFVSTIFNNLDAIAAQHGKGAELNLEAAASVKGVPYHPGAAKYFEEKGVKVDAVKDGAGTGTAARSGAAALSGKRIPHSDQTRQKILQIRTFDLQTGFFCPGAPVKNFQNQVRPIPDRNLQLILQVSLLGRCQGVVKNHAVCIQHGNQIFDLFHLSCPDIKGIIDHRKILHNLRRCFDLTRLRKVFQLLHRMVKIQIFV